MRDWVLRSLFVLFCVLTVGNISYAADFSKKIPTGSSYGDVLAMWGEPSEKVEKSLKREVVWYYPDDAKVVFKDGKSRSFQSTKAVRTVEAQIEAAKIELSASEAQLSGAARDLVKDIAKEVPSGPDLPAPPVEAGSVANLGQPQAIVPNTGATLGRGGPPAISPGEVALDEGED